jgi:enoyl-CoA hydratase
MVRGGFEFAVRLLEFPRPVVIACTGHAVAMGLFLSQAGDYRVGASGPYKFQANEVALGLTLPYAAVEILRYRMAPGCFDRATALAEIFPPDGALGAGLLDRVVAPELVAEVARGAAGALLGLNMDAHLATKLRARQQLRSAIRAGIDADYGAVRA